MKTKYGPLAINSVISRIEEFRVIGEKQFLALYSNGRGAKSTWISFEGEIFPAKAIFRAAFLPQRLPPTFQTSDTYVFARELGLEIIWLKDGALETKRSAIEDIDEFNGPIFPNRKIQIGERIVRDGKIRKAVLRRANGRCEHCGEQGFLMVDGNFYLETHHIISLSKQGPDSSDNVIALCPKDHRRAHYGIDSEELESEFKVYLLNIRNK